MSGSHWLQQQIMSNNNQGNLVNEANHTSNPLTVIPNTRRIMPPPETNFHYFANTSTSYHPSNSNISQNALTNQYSSLCTNPNNLQTNYNQITNGLQVLATNKQLNYNKITNTSQNLATKKQSHGSQFENQSKIYQTINNKQISTNSQINYNQITKESQNTQQITNTKSSICIGKMHDCLKKACQNNKFMKCLVGNVEKEIGSYNMNHHIWQIFALIIMGTTSLNIWYFDSLTQNTKRFNDMLKAKFKMINIACTLEYESQIYGIIKKTIEEFKHLNSNHQIHQSKFFQSHLNYNQLPLHYNQIINNVNQLGSNYNSITNNSNQLQSNYNQITNNTNQLGLNYNHNQLQSNYNQITNNLNQLGSNYNSITKNQTAVNTLDINQQGKQEKNLLPDEKKKELEHKKKQNDKKNTTKDNEKFMKSIQRYV